MSDMDKKYFRRVSMDEGSEADYASSIKKLSEFLTRHYGKKTIILIDEYDVPIQQAYLKKSYSKHFGFIETEVEELLNYYGIESQLEEVRNWYNGYIFGNTVVYNPWSVLQYTHNWEEGFQPYWVNTSDNEMVHRLISRGGPNYRV